MGILRRAGVEAISVGRGTSVMDALAVMREGSVDTVFVVEHGVVVGAFTHRDLAVRVVLGRRDPDSTPVGEVMTSPAITLPTGATVADALDTMAVNGVPQLPVVTSEGVITGMVGLRDIYREQNIDLNAEIDSIIAYHAADGIGG